MTISSIHFQKAEVEFAEKHNFRTEKKEPEYLLDKQYRKTNEYLKLHDPKELYQEQMELRKQNHSRGFAPHLKDVYWEAVVNLDEKHSLADVKKVADFIQQKYHLQPCSIALHHDEGYTDKDGTVKYNHHAHLCFLTMDNGISTMRKIRSKELRQMQTEVAQLLGLERGKEHSQAMRLNHQQYRAVMKAQEELTRENVKELNVFYNQKLNNKISELQSTLIKPLLTLSKKLTDEKAELETEKQTLTTQLEAEKKNIKTVTKTVTVTRDLTDDEIELLPKVSELKKKLTESETALSEAPVKTQKELNELKSKIRREMIAESGFTQEQYKALNEAAASIKKFLKTENYTVSDVINTLLGSISKVKTLTSEKTQLETQLEAEKKNVKTETVTKTVLRDYTDDEIDNLPKVVKLNSTVKSLNETIKDKNQKIAENEQKLTKKVQKIVIINRNSSILTENQISNLPQMKGLKAQKDYFDKAYNAELKIHQQLQEENNQLSAKLKTVTEERDILSKFNSTVLQVIQAMHSDFDLEHPIESLKKIYIAWKTQHQKSTETPQKRSQSDESTIKRVEVQQTSQSQSMSVLNASQPKEKRYSVVISRQSYDLTAKDIHDWLEDYPEDKDSIAKQLSEADRREVFGEPTRTAQKQTPARVKHSLER